jgi:hypothetical protein
VPHSSHGAVPCEEWETTKPSFGIASQITARQVCIPLTVLS